MNSEIKLNDCLKILNLNRNASIDEIKKAYRKLAKQYHPDIAGKEEYYVQKFREITKAYKTLLENIDKDKIKIEEDNKFSITAFFNKKFRIKNYINFFKIRKKPKKDDVVFGEIFYKRVSPEILRLSEEELIIRLEGTTNFYVMLEAIKALYKVGTKDGLISIIENYYKYPEKLKEFVVFIMKKRLNNNDNLFNSLSVISKKGNYEAVVSIIGFLFNLHDKKLFSNNYLDIMSKKIIKEFIKNHMSNLKNIYLFIEALKVKIKFGLNYNELKLGEKLVFNKKISPYQLIIALTVKERFQNVKIGKILLDLNFISINDLKKALR